MATKGKRLVIVGGGGRLGKALARAWTATDDILTFDRTGIDLASPESIERALEPLEFDALVNCAALTNVDYCETHREEAFAVNAEAVGRIGRICSRKNARCVHIGTDYVFDGTKDTPYTEEDEPTPISVYGESKRQGEVELLEASPEHLVVRVAWVFGPDRPSFVDQILKRAMETDALQAIGDKWSCPTYTLDAAAMLHPFLQKTAASGILHLTQTGSCTWQEYGQYALDVAAAAGVPLEGRRVGFQAMADLKAFIARRPVRTTLSTTRLEQLSGRAPRPWQEAVSDYVRGYYTPGPAGCGKEQV